MWSARRRMAELKKLLSAPETDLGIDYCLYSSRDGQPELTELDETRSAERHSTTLERCLH